MRHLLLLLLLPLGLLLGGCDFRDRLRGPEDRINAVFALSQDAHQARERLLARYPENSPQWQSARQDWDQRLQARALECGQGYKASWRQSNEQVRSRIGATACFKSFDQRLVAWVNLRRIRQLLLQDSIAGALPEEGGPLNVSRRGLGIISMEGQGSSSVLLMRSVNQTELVALTDGKPLFAYQPSQSAIESVSPNGRLFIERLSEHIRRIRATEGGEVLLELMKTASVHWIGTRYLAVADVNADRYGYLIDLETAEEVPVPAKQLVAGYRFLPVPGHDRRVNVLSFIGMEQFEVQTQGGRSTALLVAETPWEFGFRFGAQEVQEATGGKTWLIRMNSDVLLVDPLSLGQQRISMAPAYVRDSSPMAEAGKYLVKLEAGSPNSGNGYYVLDGAALTLARVQGPEQEEELRYFSQVGRYVKMGRETLQLLSRLQIGPALALDSAIGAMLEESNNRKLREAEEQMRALMQNAAITPDSPLFQRMQTAQIEGVGVYEPRAVSTAPGAPRGMGPVDVLVRRSPRPLVLVLSSYHAVQWRVRLEPGARLEAVLQSGYEDSTVLGAGAARVLKIGQEHAYQSEGPEFQALQRQVTRWTTKPIQLFQGSYQGTAFSVGGS